MWLKEKNILYTRKLYYKHFTTVFDLCEFTTREQKFEIDFVLKNWFKTFVLKISVI